MASASICDNVWGMCTCLSPDSPHYPTAMHVRLMHALFSYLLFLFPFYFIKPPAIKEIHKKSLGTTCS